GGGAHPSRQAQAHLHAAPGHGRLRGGRQRRPGDAHGAEGGSEDLLPPHGVHGAREAHPVSPDEGEASGAAPGAGRQGDAPQERAGSGDVQQAARVRGRGASPSGAAPRTSDLLMSDMPNQPRDLNEEQAAPEAPQSAAPAPAPRSSSGAKGQQYNGLG